MGPQTQVERRTRTRERLLDAALGTFSRSGYHATTVDAVAARAGYSTGALYAHFASKEALFLGLVEAHVGRQVERYTEAVSAGETLEERSRAGADEWMAYMREQPEYFPLFMAFWSYAIGNDALRPDLAERFRGLRDIGAKLLVEGADDLGVPMVEGMPEKIGTVVTALGNGLALHKLAAPEDVPDELFGDTMVLFFSALAALSREIASADAEHGSANEGHDGDVGAGEPRVDG